jgi:hypothetical protein
LSPDTKLDRAVAIKVLPDALVVDPDASLGSSAGIATDGSCFTAAATK